MANQTLTRVTTSQTRYVAYYRVSTKAQGESGLGLDAQRTSVVGYVTGSDRRAVLVAEFTEVESGKKDKRVELMAAIDRARREGAVLVIARLDRNGGPAIKSQCQLHLYPARFRR